MLTGAFLALVALIGGRLVADGKIGLGEFIAAVGLTGYLTGPFSLSSYVVVGPGPRARLGRARRRAARRAGRRRGRHAAPARTPARGDRAARRAPSRPATASTSRSPPASTSRSSAADAADGAALVELLVRDADPAAGAIALDGTAFAELDPELLRAAVRVSAHDAELFDGSLGDNVRAAARGAAAAARRRRRSPRPTSPTSPPRCPAASTPRSASAGARCRAASASASRSRARWPPTPPVLVLHDPTTAVDAVTEARIAARVRALRAGRTTIVVTSSPALLAAADRVVLVAGGRAVAERRARRPAARRRAYRAAVLE